MNHSRVSALGVCWTLTSLGVALVTTSCLEPWPKADLPVSIAVDSTQVAPGHFAIAHVVANAPTGNAITDIVIELSGATQSYDSTFVNYQRSLTRERLVQPDATAPAAADAKVHVAVRVYGMYGSTGSAEYDLHVVDGTAPTATIATIPPGVTAATQGDSLFVKLTAHDNAAIQYTAFHVSGALSLVDSLNGLQLVGRTLALTVPNSATVGDSIIVTAHVGDYSGNDVTSNRLAIQIH